MDNHSAAYEKLSKTLDEEMIDRIIRVEMKDIAQTFKQQDKRFPGIDELTRISGYTIDEINTATKAIEPAFSTGYLRIFTEEVDTALYNAAIKGSVSAIRLWHQLKEGFGQKPEHRVPPVYEQFVINLRNGMPKKNPDGSYMETDPEGEAEEDNEDEGDDQDDNESCTSVKYSGMEERVAHHMAHLSGILPDDDMPENAPGMPPVQSETIIAPETGVQETGSLTGVSSAESPGFPEPGNGMQENNGPAFADNSGMSVNNQLPVNAGITIENQDSVSANSEENNISGPDFQHLQGSDIKQAELSSEIKFANAPKSLRPEQPTLTKQSVKSALKVKSNKQNQISNRNRLKFRRFG
ncbi:MAG: hypothetical protein V4543_13250 [Bacteroidota bacterium]